MILFLDFDGVLHPLASRFGAEVYCYLPHLEGVLRDFPAVKIVIASNQREKETLDQMASRFSGDIAARIIGVTPVSELRDAGDIPESRYREILAYLGNSDENWLALDDDASLYPPCCPQLILCDDGFRGAEEAALRKALAKKSTSSTLR